MAKNGVFAFNNYGLGASVKHLKLTVAASALGLMFAQSPAFAVICGFENQYCVAPTTPGSGGSRLETMFLAGIQWNFGDSQPELVLGFRRTFTQPDSQVFGGQFDVAIPLKFEMAPIKPIGRILGVAGNRDIQADFGFGLRAFDWAPVVAGGAQLPFTTAGANYVFGEGFKPYAGVDTIRRAAAPGSQGGNATCPANYTLSSSTQGVYPAAIVAGQTCQSNSIK